MAFFFHQYENLGKISTQNAQTYGVKLKQCYRYHECLSKTP